MATHEYILQLMHLTTISAKVKLTSTSYSGTLIYLTSNYPIRGLFSQYMSASIDYISFKLLKNSSYTILLWSFYYYLLFLLHFIYLFIYSWMLSVRYHIAIPTPAHFSPNCLYQCLPLVANFSTSFYYLFIFLTLQHTFFINYIYSYISWAVF